MNESDITATSVTRLISHFYYEVFDAAGIEYNTKRTGNKRLIKLKMRDGYDENDSKNGMVNTPSLLSSSVTERGV